MAKCLIVAPPQLAAPRGELILGGGALLAEGRRGRFLPRAAGPSGRREPELDPERDVSAELLK